MKWSVLQVGVLVVSILNTLWALAGLIANPSFATGDDLTSVTVLGVDFNGWHAVSGLLVFLPGLVAFREHLWSWWYSVAMIPAIAGPGVWALIDDAPMGLWPFEHQAADALLHFVTAAVYGVLLFVDHRQPGAVPERVGTS